MDPQRDFPADVLANILMRLPPNTRRRLRLVCRHWRYVVGTRTATSLRSRAKTLVAATGSACVIDNLWAPWKPRELWPEFMSDHYKPMSVVGTCNGLVCLCDDRELGGAITVANPVTGEVLRLPPLPPPRFDDQSTCYDRSWHAAYSFAYLPTSGLYKVVHVPCHLDRSVYDKVHVITLGEKSWRGVPASSSAKCSLGDNVISVDGVTYWTTPEADKVMSFDLEHGRFTSIRSLPSVVLSSSKNGGSWHLGDVHGRLAIVFTQLSPAMERTEVWVMQGRTVGQIRWSCSYIIQTRTPPHRPREPSSRTKMRRLTWPLLVQDEQILTWEWSLYERDHVLYRHKPIDDHTRNAKHGVVDISERNRGMVVADINMLPHRNDRRTFAYVETKEPLSGYGPLASPFPFYMQSSSSSLSCSHLPTKRGHYQRSY
ncbi:hypothetical protein VPH35_121543 [Triticum aestivum]|uniref:F-box domain-containing protein n=1 Tax=Triticum aestivum TaxID=4565 RepID=A0A3B6RAL5_WHEAT